MISGTQKVLARLHWGCGDVTPPGWINADLEARPGVDITGSILDGLPLETETIDYITSQHALNELAILEQEPALRELRRVLKPDGVLRLCLPDLNLAIEAFRRGQQDYFMDWDWDTIDGNFICHILDYNYTRTLFTYPFAEELLLKAGFREVRQVKFGLTETAHPEITQLDSRKETSFFVEAVK